MKDNIDLQFPISGKVLRSGNYAFTLRAKQLIDEAKASAVDILTKAKNIYSMAYDVGLKDGNERANLDLVKKQLQMVKMTSDYYINVEKKLIKVVTECVKKIIDNMPPEDVLLLVVKQALNTMRRQKQVIIRVNAEDEPRLQKQMKSLNALYPNIGLIEILVDASVLKGGCIVSSAIGTVETSVYTQMQVVENALYSQLATSMTDKNDVAKSDEKK